jgi:hypothetical protein
MAVPWKGDRGERLPHEHVLSTPRPYQILPSGLGKITRRGRAIRCLKAGGLAGRSSVAHLKENVAAATLELCSEGW